ncbi:BTAD domain-containing putative transcriptional regulator [Streptomyces sp. NPDC041068]|uniref:BTAD domain-containing putative transcriptional regulator n=1 Tax=Streptomyces sp. NPDC041068 TaxID=3155130 RepID=UPI00340BC878
MDLGAPRQRSVAAALLLRANRPVTRGQLIQAVWGEPAPAYAVNQLQKYVSALRRVLEPERESRSPSGILNWSDSGYVLEVPPEAVDLTVFERGAGLAREARLRGDAERAADELRKALGLWQGPALANVSSAFLDAERGRLEELRAAAQEERVQAELDLGRHRDVVPELSRLAAEFPLRERFTALLMLALYRSGRQSDALSAYQRTRRSLREELGVDPGPEVQELHGRILALEPSLSPRPAEPRQARPQEQPSAAEAAQDPLPTPEAVQGLHQLPMDTPEFVGRERELSALRELAGDIGAVDDPGDSGVIVAVVEGMAGAGKTRLAVHAAHRLVAAGRFTDVQLWADLRGFAPDREPADPAAVLEDFLRLLGVPGAHIPAQLEARAALFRDRLAGKRALVVLDDAADDEQVRFLLPGTASCLLLITTRRVLTGLDGAHTFRLGGFAPVEAVALMRRVTGREQLGPDPAPSLRVAELCGHLPLAVALAGRRLRSRPSWSMADLAARLEAGEQRLRRLAVGSRAVNTAFALSYRSLPARHRLAFRRLALHPGEDCTPGSAAALLDTDHREAEDLLEALLDEHLLEQHTSGRYRHHSLLRLYAHERLREEDGAESEDGEDIEDRQDREDREDREQQCTAALRRLVHWYCDTAEAARHALEPSRSPRHEPSRRTWLEPSRSPRLEALEWLEQERANLLAVSHEAARRGWHAATWRLAAAAHSFLGLHAYGTDSLTGLRLGLAAARATRDRAQQARLMYDLGLVYDALGRHPEAEEHHHHALERFEEIGDLHGAADALYGLGRTSEACGRYEESVQWHERALALFRETGDRHGEARATSGLALAHWFAPAGQDESEARHRDALALLRKTGDKRRQAHEIGNLGLAHWFFGNYADCALEHRRALALFEEVGDRRGQAAAHHGLGLADWHLGRPTEACEHHQYALATYRDLRDARGEARTLQRLGYVHWTMGRYAEGEAELRGSLSLSQSTGNRNTEAWARTSLGFLCQRLRRDREAEELLRQGLGLSRRIGDRHSESSALLGLALVALNQGELTVCEERSRQSLALTREIHNPHGETWAMIGLGLALCFGGRYEEGTAWHLRAAALARRIHEPHSEAMALNGLGHGCTRLARHEEAERHLRAALAHRQRILDRHGEAETLTDLAALLRVTHRPEAARVGAERAQAIYEELLAARPDALGSSRQPKELQADEAPDTPGPSDALDTPDAPDAPDVPDTPRRRPDRR